MRLASVASSQIDARQPVPICSSGLRGPLHAVCRVALAPDPGTHTPHAIIALLMSRLYPRRPRDLRPDYGTPHVDIKNSRHVHAPRLHGVGAQESMTRLFAERTLAPSGSALPNSYSDSACSDAVFYPGMAPT